MCLCVSVYVSVSGSVSVAVSVTISVLSWLFVRVRGCLLLCSVVRSFGYVLLCLRALTCLCACLRALRTNKHILSEPKQTTNKQSNIKQIKQTDQTTNISNKSNKSIKQQTAKTNNKTKTDNKQTDSMGYGNFSFVSLFKNTPLLKRLKTNKSKRNKKKTIFQTIKQRNKRETALALATKTGRRRQQWQQHFRH